MCASCGMEKFFCCAAMLAALSISSCLKEQVQSGNDNLVNLTISIPQTASKVVDASSSDEDRILDSQVFVFGTGGVLEAYAKDDATTLTLGVAAGTKNIYALVNAPDLSRISSEKELVSYETILSDNQTDKFVMFGALLDEPVSSSRGSKTVHVSRVVAKVILQGIRRQFSSPSLAAKSFTVDAVYLTGVAGNAILDNARLQGGEPSRRIWYNKQQYVPGECSSLLFDAVGQALANGEELSTVHCFYPYPNPDKTTMLVIEATLGGEKTYYPVYLPALQSNRVYIISNFTLTRKGSDKPWQPVEDDQVTFSIVPEQWQAGATWSETI